MKHTTRICDICNKTVPDVNEEDLINEGWSQIRYSFGRQHNAYNAIASTKDVCPECSLKLGLIKANKENPKYPIRPNKDKKVSDEVDTNIMTQIREFIVQTGEEEGWYKE